MANFNRDRSGGRRDFSNRGFNRRGFSDRSREDRPMFPAVCSNCGRDCQVPFEPTGEKPVYCSDCFQKINGESPRRFDDRSSKRPSFDRRSEARPQNNAQLDAVIQKLDRILELLSTPTPTKAKKSVSKETKKEAKTEEILTKVKLGKKKAKSIK